MSAKLPDRYFPVRFTADEVIALCLALAQLEDRDIRSPRANALRSAYRKIANARGRVPRSKIQ